MNAVLAVIFIQRMREKKSQAKTEEVKADFCDKDLWMKPPNLFMFDAAFL